MTTTFKKNGVTVTIKSEIIKNEKNEWFFVCNGVKSVPYKSRATAKNALQDHIDYVANV